jgi:hypothetical protein
MNDIYLVLKHFVLKKIGSGAITPDNPLPYFPV